MRTCRAEEGKPGGLRDRVEISHARYLYWVSNLRALEDTNREGLQDMSII
jgi:hypothetical protein